MTADSTLGLWFALAIVVWASTLLLWSRWKFKRLIICGLWLRVVGSLAYLYLFNTIKGGGDYFAYFRNGLEYRDALSTPTAVQLWLDARWWGTPFVDRVTALVLSVVGASLPGAFVVFGAIGYVGIVALATAFMRAFPQGDHRRLLLWLIFFPSLFFWPAALGKDALVLCGIGLATLGFVGRAGRPGWTLLIFGICMVFFVRPQVAALLAFSAVTAHWLDAAPRWTVSDTAQGVVLLAVGIGVIAVAGAMLRVEFFDPSEAQAYLGQSGAKSSIGGSEISGGGGRSFLMAPINTLLRPFPWDPGGSLGMTAAAEVAFLWAVGLYRRRQVVAFFRARHRNRLTWLSLIFVVTYATALGIAISNMGILARQRVHILPFVIMFLVGIPRHRRFRVLGGSLQDPPWPLRRGEVDAGKIATAASSA